MVCPAVGLPFLQVELGPLAPGKPWDEDWRAVLFQHNCLSLTKLYLYSFSQYSQPSAKSLQILCHDEFSE